MNDEKIAVIGPAFFGYCEAIVNEYNSRGVKAFFINELPDESLLRKIIYRLRLKEIVKKNHIAYLEKILRKLKDENATQILIISPDSCDSSFCEKLIFLGYKVKVYMWDSIKNKHLGREYIQKFKGVASFDMEDCSRHTMTYIPLFAEPDFFYDSKEIPRLVDIAFVGTLHSNRIKLIKSIKEFCESHGLVFEFIGYYYSLLLFLFKFLASGVYFFIFKKVTFRKLLKSDIGALYQQSKFVLDIHHHEQAGLTSRSFEALMSGAYLITTNKNALSLPLGLSDRCLYVPRNSIRKSIEELNLNFQTFQPSTLTAQQISFLSTSRFVDQITSLPPLEISND
jgi:hypothetical protein